MRRSTAHRASARTARSSDAAARAFAAKSAVCASRFSCDNSRSSLAISADSNRCVTEDRAANERREATACSSARWRCDAASRCDASSPDASAAATVLDGRAGGAVEELPALAGRIIIRLSLQKPDRSYGMCVGRAFDSVCACVWCVGVGTRAVCV